MEFVRINFPNERTVFIDGQDNGKTNTILRVDPGTHHFDLGDPQNYSPAFQDKLIEGTSALEPLELDFSPQGNA
jgi:hypothetical protein